MFDPNSIEALQFSTEKQILDRKPARIKAVDLAIPIVAMANADGGFLAIGIEDDGTITGVDAYEKNLNELMRAPFDFCIPSVRVDLKMMDVFDHKWWGRLRQRGCNPSVWKESTAFLPAGPCTFRALRGKNC